MFVRSTRWTISFHLLRLRLSEVMSWINLISSAINSKTTMHIWNEFITTLKNEEMHTFFEIEKNNENGSNLRSLLMLGECNFVYS